MNVNKIVLLAKAQVLAILITAKQFSTYDYVGVVDRAEDLKGKVCLNGLDIIGKQQSLINKHGLQKIMNDSKLFEKLVACGLVINSGGLYECNGKRYYLPLHITTNRRRTLGTPIYITDAQHYIKSAENKSDVNKFLAEYGLPGSRVDIHGDCLNRIWAITANNRYRSVNNKCDGHNISIELTGDYRYACPHQYKNRLNFNNKGSILEPNYMNYTRFRIEEHIGVRSSSILIEKYIMMLIMGHTHEYPILNWTSCGLQSCQANVMTGNANIYTANKITGYDFTFIDFNCVEPVMASDNKAHGDNIATVSHIINSGLKFYSELKGVCGQGRAVVSFSANDPVIKALCKEYKASKDIRIADMLFTYMVCCCNIHMVQ